MKIGPVPLVLAPALAFGIFWSVTRVIAYFTWTEEDVAKDFANAALPTHYNSSSVAEGFRNEAIHFLFEHALLTKAHVLVGAVAAVSFTLQLVFNTKARLLHRIVSKFAGVSAFTLVALNVYVMFIRPEGMAPVGSAAYWSNVVATVTLACALVIGLSAIFGNPAAPNYSLHRRAMIVAAGALFMNPAERFVLAVVAHIPGLVPPSYNTWPAYRDGPWNAGLWAGAALSFGTAALYAAGIMGDGNIAAAQATAAAARNAKKAL